MIIAYQGSLRGPGGRHSTIWNVDDSVLRALARIDSKNKYILFNYGSGGRAGIESQLPGPRNAANFSVFVPKLPQGLTRWAEKLGFDPRGRLLGPKGAALLHISEQIYPAPPSFPTIVTFHDLIPELHPEWSTPRNLSAMRHNAKRARHLLADSESTKRDLIRVYSVSEDRVTVVPLGVDRSTFKKYGPSELSPIKNKIKLPERFILCLGPFGPRKNLQFVLQAYPRWKEKHRNLGLVFVGEKTEYRSLLEQTVQSKSIPDTVFIDTVSSSELVGLYNLADCFVYPSLYEGFGLPILEAMACGCPVLAANNSCIPEAVGDAGCLFSLDDPAELIRQGEEVLGNPATRQRLAVAGEARAKQFTWEETAGKLLKVYERFAA